MRCIVILCQARLMSPCSDLKWSLFYFWSTWNDNYFVSEVFKYAILCFKQWYSILLIGPILIIILLLKNSSIQYYFSNNDILFFLSLLYSGGEVWEGIWNQSHLVVLHFCLERSHHVPFLTIRHAQTVGVNDLSFLEHTEQSTSITEILA